MTNAPYEVPDPVNHPAHYTAGAVEVIVVARCLPFALGNAVKYLCRAHLKGTELQDLRKAEWYLTDAIAHPVELDSNPGPSVVEELACGLSYPRGNAVVLIADGHPQAALTYVRDEIARLESDESKRA